MSFESGSVAQLSDAADRPPSAASAEYKLSDHHWVDWHRANDEVFDFQLDVLSSVGTPAQSQAGLHNHLPQDFAWRAQTANMSATQSPQNETYTAASTADATPQVKIGEDHKTSPPQATDNHLILNGFDHPYTQQEHTQPEGHVNTPSSLSIEPKKETPEVPTIGTSNRTATSPSPAFQVAQGGHHLQRVATEPTIQAHADWTYLYPHERANNQHLQVQNWHNAPRSVLQKHQHARKLSANRLRAQTNPTSHPRQHPSAYVSALGLGHHASAHCGWSHGMAAYAPTQGIGGSPSFFPATVSDGELGYSSQGSPESGSLNTGIYKNVLNPGVAGGQNRFAQGFGFQHSSNNVVPQIVKPTELHYRSIPFVNNNNVPPANILKLQPERTTEDIQTKRQSNSLPRSSTMKQKRTRAIAEIDEDGRSEDDITRYKSVEEAREAERPTFTVYPKKDPTIPRTAREQQEMVARMVRCMRDDKVAQDNKGMITQWTKLKRDEARVEQAAWRIMVWLSSYYPSEFTLTAV
ncbi:MAG: hypothetical protein Q9179_003486 [Wetmoreana sp. 5 TL-2023]